MPQQLNEICLFLEEFAPNKLAADWDNVGLLVGDTHQTIERTMTCLTVTPDVVQEAVSKRCDLIVTHHPMPFRAVKKITNASIVGKMLLELMQNRIAVYSPHTAFDSAQSGINQTWAEGLNLESIEPMEPDEIEPELGTGRVGRLPEQLPLAEVIKQIKALTGLTQVRVVGDLTQSIKRIAIGCGAAGEFLSMARRHKSDLFITGETNFHTCLDAKAHDVAMILTGHYASERFAVERLAEILSRHHPELEIWASETDVNPWIEV